MSKFINFQKDHLVLFDGAMGTLLFEKGVFIDKCYDALNLNSPELIKSIHSAYKEAGATVIETNTFGANRFKLSKYNLATDIERINVEGVRLARDSKSDRIFIAGSMGPLGIQLEPWGETSFQEAQDAFREQASALVAETGIDLFAVETIQNIREMEQAVIAIKEVSDLPIMATMALQEDGRTSYGNTIEEIVEAMEHWGVYAMGINCALGPKQMLDLLEVMVQLTRLPIAVMPNAGTPQYVDGRSFYMATPEYFGVYAKRFIEAGAQIIGGCCGTTPAHINKMAAAMAQKQTRLEIHALNKVKVSRSLKDIVTVPFADKSRVASKLNRGEFVAMVEMVSPKGRDIAKQVAGAKKLKEAGIDAINIPDGPRASARMNGLALAVMLQNQVDIEAVLHYTCRDRNLLGMQSDLLGASVLGIKNILAITGDPPMMGDYPQATAVFDIDAIGLTNILTNLNRGMDIGSKSIGDPTGFLIGVGVDPNSINLKKELDRFQWKLDAGAEFAITQPVFDPKALENFINQVTQYNIFFIAGIWPLMSLRNAEFMRNEVPGVNVPDTVIERIGRYASKDDQLKVGVEIAQEMAEMVSSMTHGIQVSAPFGRVEVALSVIDAIKTT